VDDLRYTRIVKIANYAMLIVRPREHQLKASFVQTGPMDHTVPVNVASSGAESNQEKLTLKPRHLEDVATGPIDFWSTDSRCGSPSDIGALGRSPLTSQQET
jgi:hypothetical protein